MSTNASNDWPFGITEIKAPDGSISAKFVSLGTTLTELWVKDKYGKMRDVVLGYDDNTCLLSDPGHPVFNAIVGRYAGRIKNGTFSIPISKNPDQEAIGNVYHVPTNDHDGQVTLHGGIIGWDRRSWSLVEQTPTSVTYKHVDNGDEGFPGTVTAFTTHSVSNGGIFRTKIHATATEKTPIMLTQHNYWNLDAFQDDTNDVLEHDFRLDASRVIEVDDISIPTGKFIDVTKTPFDFRKEQKFSARWNETVDLCGKGGLSFLNIKTHARSHSLITEGSTGYNAGWVLDNAEEEHPVASLKSDKSGIRLDISTNQPIVVVYTSYWLDAPRKVIHGGPTLRYESNAAVAIEQQGYIAAINTPEWDVDQIYYPGKDYEWRSEYKFSVVR